MAVFVPQGPDFQWWYSNTLTTRPAAAYGTSITPSTTVGSYGSWAQVASSANISQEVYGVAINFNSAATAGTARSILAEMGVDSEGGTNYQSVIPYLIAGAAHPFTIAPGGIYYYFPLYIKAGSSVAFRGMSNFTTAFNVSVYFYGQPRRPDAVRCGSYVDAYGVDVTNLIGTSVTMGSTSEGAWTQLGTATTRNYWWWQIGFNSTSTALAAAASHFDIAAGDATSKKTLIENQKWFTTTSEEIGCIPHLVNAYNNVATGDLIYGRGQGQAAISGANMIAYGLGG